MVGHDHVEARHPRIGAVVHEEHAPALQIGLGERSTGRDRPPESVMKPLVARDTGR